MEIVSISELFKRLLTWQANDVPTSILDDFSDFKTAKRAGSWLFSDVEQSGQELGSILFCPEAC